MSGVSAVDGFTHRYQLNETRFGIVRKSVSTLPVIDVGPLVFGGSASELSKTASEIREACINSGFFYITNYGITDAEMRVVADAAIRFFHLPIDRKMKATTPGFIHGRGYMPMDSEKITPGYEPDFKEYYDFGAEFEDQSLMPIDRGTTFWPEPGDAPGFQTIMRDHVKRTMLIGQKVMRGFALALDLPPDFFDAAHQTPFFNFRPSFYPPARDVLKQNKWSCGPHTDYLSMTMLWQDEVGGLEVLNLSGDWIDASPMAETMVLNIADMMSIWTNDLFTSNPHRVANRTTNHRLSLAHFMGPSPTTIVECLPTCQSADNPPRYQPTTTTQHVTNIMAKSLSAEVMKDVVVENSAATDQLRSAERIGG
jgi:isopenicillin N synthase-like dioxygenase